MHHAFGVARGARGEKHGGHVVGLVDGHFFVEKCGGLLCKLLAPVLQVRQADQTNLLVVAQSAWVVKINMCQPCTVRANFQQLIDLLLVFHHRKTHIGIVNGKHIFSGDSVLVKRHWNRTQTLYRQHAGVQARAIGPHHDHMFAALQAGLVQATGQALDHLGQGLPCQALPNTVFLFPQCSGQRPARSVL